MQAKCPSTRSSPGTGTGSSEGSGSPARGGPGIVRESVPASEKRERVTGQAAGERLGRRGFEKGKDSEAKVKTSEGRQSASSRWKSAPASGRASEGENGGMLDGEAALTAAGVPRLGLARLGGRGKGREGLRHRSGPRWMAWKGRRSSQPAPNPLGGRAAAAGDSMGLEKDAVRIKENDWQNSRTDTSPQSASLFYEGGCAVLGNLRGLAVQARRPGRYPDSSTRPSPSLHPRRPGCLHAACWSREGFATEFS